MQTRTLYIAAIELTEKRLFVNDKVKLLGFGAETDAEREGIKEILSEETVEEFVTFLIKKVAKSNFIKIEELNDQLTLIEILPPDECGVQAMRDLIFDLEDHYDIVISDAEWDMIEQRKVGLLCNLIERKLLIKKKLKLQEKKLGRNSLKNLRLDKLPIPSILQS